MLSRMLLAVDDMPVAPESADEDEDPPTDPTPERKPVLGVKELPDAELPELPPEVPA
jgi:hypothetical protein